VSVVARPAASGTEGPGSAQTGQRGTAIVAALGFGIVLVAQIPLAIGLLDPDVVFEAGHAKSFLVANALVAIVSIVGAALLPLRRRWLALIPGAIIAGASLLASIMFGQHGGDLASAALTLMGAWWIGRATLMALRARPLQGVFVIEAVVGLIALAMVVLLVGRVDGLAWWTVGLVTIAAGMAGLAVGARTVWARQSDLWNAVSSNRLAVAAVALLLIQIGWIVVWLSAPEIMFDPLYAKTYLPQIWARSGDIGPLLSHPALNTTGLAQLVAVPGHTLHAPDTGRWLQLLAWVVLVATVWTAAGRGSPVGPVAAIAVGTVPQLTWQASTAFDDLLLSTGAIAIAIAVLRAGQERVQTPGFGTAVAIGLLAGGCAWLKLHLVVLAVVTAVGWLAITFARAGALRRVAGVVLGGCAALGPSLLIRWIDTGNPVFPAYNEIFRSPHYPAINETYNFPYWAHVHLTDALLAFVDAVRHPVLMNEAAPPGEFGLLVAAIAVGALVGWRRSAGRVGAVLWIALIASLVVWWVELRYLRYLVPTAFVATVLILTQLRGWQPTRRTGRVLLGTLALASLTYLPSTVATFWNVPHRKLPVAAAFGRWDREDYLRTVFPEKDALEAFQRSAPVGALAISDAHERLFLTDRDLSPAWEVGRLMEIDGPQPTGADDARRRLRELGINWALLATPSGFSDGFPWLQEVVRERGQPVFADRGWTLYRLGDRPSLPQASSTCDTSLRGEPRCWAGTLDRDPGLTAAESPGGASRSVETCGGQIVGVRVATAPSGAPSQVALNFNGTDAKAGHTAGAILPGQSDWVYGTAPRGAHQVVITLIAGANAKIDSARTGVFGACAR
jgi:hypothetical protein